MSTKINTEALLEEVGTLAKLEQVGRIGEVILESCEATSIENKMSSSEIYEIYRQLLEKEPNLPDISKNTFVVYLSRISSDQHTKIICPGHRQGYFLNELVTKLEELENDIALNNSEATRAAIQEKDLYPILKEWLFKKNYDRVADISAYRANGKWGNPDLVALSIEELYGATELEITTIEAKLFEDQWEQWIFEAIAHTRFSNRSYFAFLYPEEWISKLDSTDLKLYAEHFNIGILVLGIDDDKYLKIKSREETQITSEEVTVLEYHQAPYNNTHVKLRKKFLSSLDILEDKKKLYSFGTDLD
ncbi:hypothetical protein SapgrDRAFT_2301 [Saprospira grandis DSM 2844]|uniref:Uncharacterized protein n=1 Tax=Saprospira grandis DSM 2844 TaxID=694433 RepID=J0P2D8_9BACT|nr:hypothetical protein [Saprospira grandis]EJF53969.1 hypothetical protein SapgrDRAFT_2301 [Saprospira grandis DSM 2844]